MIFGAAQMRLAIIILWLLVQATFNYRHYFCPNERRGQTSRQRFTHESLHSWHELILKCFKSHFIAKRELFYCLFLKLFSFPVQNVCFAKVFASVILVKSAFFCKTRASFIVFTFVSANFLLLQMHFLFLSLSKICDNVHFKIINAITDFLRKILIISIASYNWKLELL